MLHVRLVPLTFLVALGFGIGSSPTRAQDKDADPVDKKPQGYVTLTNMKTEGVTDAKLEEAKIKFVAFAQYNADVISWAKRYSQLQDPTIELARDKTLDGIFAEMESKLIIANPANKVGPDKANYVREMGKALDDALKEVVLKNPDRAVKVNAMRMLAIACKTGAHAHYPTITALIGSPTIKVGDVDVPVPPEVRYYALQAAGNLLSAYNLGSFNINTQSGYNDRNHSNDDAAVVALLAALEKAILDPAALIGVAAADIKLQENRDVAAYFRRQAVKALGQCRFAMFPEKNPTHFPSVVLARVAVSDPSLAFSPRADEVAEAVIGICNMDPPERVADRVQYGNGMAEVIATAVYTFGGDRGANPSDKAVAWKGMSTRMTEAISRWRARFDRVVLPITQSSPNFDPDKPGAFNLDAKFDLVKTVYDRTKVSVLDPIVAGNRPQIDAVRNFILQEARKGTEKEMAIMIFAEPKLTVPRKNI